MILPKLAGDWSPCGRGSKRYRVIPTALPRLLRRCCFNWLAMFHKFDNSSRILTEFPKLLAVSRCLKVQFDFIKLAPIMLKIYRDLLDISTTCYKLHSNAILSSIIFGFVFAKLYGRFLFGWCNHDVPKGFRITIIDLQVFRAVLILAGVILQCL